jgi:endo-1,4-beta-xylanase
MEWWTVRRNADGFDFNQGGCSCPFCADSWNEGPRHSVVWDHNHPQWLAPAHFTAAQVSQMLQEHVATVMKHYSGQVFAWDVVNEALDENGRFKRLSPV